MTTWIAWASAAGVAPGDLVLAFDAVAAREAEQAGATVDLVDDHLTWSERTAIDAQAARLATQVADNDAIDVSVRRFAAYDLRSEFVNILRAWTAATAWAQSRSDPGPTQVASDRDCPTSVVLGARAALTGKADAPAQWTPLSPQVQATGARLAAARALLETYRLTRRGRRPVRILAVPSMNAGVAIGRAKPDELRELGVGLALLATLDHGAAARLAPALGLPAVGSAWPRRSARREGAVRRQAVDALGGFHDDHALDAVLHAQAAQTLVASELPARQVGATLERWSRLPDLESVVLPTVATGAGRVALAWARANAIPVGVVQHGIYAFRGVEGGDRGADAIFTWGPGVADQIAEWEDRRARAIAIGTPGIAEMRPCAAAAPIRRALIATTNSPTGSALGLSAFQDAFVADVADGLRRLGEAGVGLELRIHPAESPARYREVIARLGLPVVVREPEPLDAALDRADLLVSSVSSVAFEAAARGIPVLLWTGRVPAEVRREQFVSPLADSWPGMFADGGSFSALIQRALQAPADFFNDVAPLRDELRRYVDRFDANAFAVGLRTLRR
jgi:hypothetical protein